MGQLAVRTVDPAPGLEQRQDRLALGLQDPVDRAPAR